MGLGARVRLYQEPSRLRLRGVTQRDCDPVDAGDEHERGLRALHQEFERADPPGCH